MHNQTQERLVRINALEAHYTMKLRVGLLRQVEQAISAFEYGAIPELAAAYVSDVALKPVLDALWLRVIVQEARYQYDALVATVETKNVAADPALGWLQRARMFVQVEGSKAIKQITATTRKLVRGTLETALQEGRSIPEAAKALRQQVGDFSAKRATTIARTELLTAANYGSYCGAATSGLPLDKFWIAAGDGRTRLSHAACAGQLVALQDSFVVGGYLAAYPGDPMLPAAERVRCRCSLGYRRRVQVQN